MSADELTAAFCAARYRIEIPGSASVCLGIGHSVPEALRHWQRDRHIASCWIITAHNPNGQHLSAGLNDARQSLLDRWLVDRGVVCLPGVNEDPAGEWPDEPTWLVAGLPVPELFALGQRFGQAALVRITQDRVSLVWLT